MKNKIVCKLLTENQLSEIKKIKDEYKKLHNDLDKKKMQLPNAIKSLGTTMVPIKLHPKVTSELKVIVREA